MPAIALRTGVRVRLKGQSSHLPGFLVMACQGDRVWVRQPNWPIQVQVCVNVTQIAIPVPVSPWWPGVLAPTGSLWLDNTPCLRR